MGLETLNNCFERSGRSLTLWMGYDIRATITSYIAVIPALSFVNLSWLFVLLLNSLLLLKHENLPFEISFKCVRWFCKFGGFGRGT